MSSDSERIEQSKRDLELNRRTLKISAVTNGYVIKRPDGSQYVYESLDKALEDIRKFFVNSKK